MRKGNKLFAALALLSLVALVLACAPTPTPEKIVQTVVVTKEVVVTPTPKPEERKLEIFHWWTAPGEREAADAMFKALKEKYPDIQVVENPVAGGGGVSHRVVLQARLSAGIPPDTWQTLGGAELKAYVDGGFLVPLDDLWKELDYAKVIPGPLAKMCSIEGHPYVVPLNIHIQNILYYNIALFDELGLKPPKNYNDLITACRTIKKAKPKMTPIALGTKEKWEAAFILDSLILEVGGPEYYVKLFKGEIDVTKDETFRKALERLKELSECFNSDHPALTWDQSVSMVGAGDAAMVLMGTWAIGAFIKGSGWQPGKDFGAVTFPQEPVRILLGHTDSYGLAKGAPHPKTTLDWLRVVASPELQIPTDVTQGGLFARLDIDPKNFPDPIRQELQTYVREHPDKLILDQHGSIAPYAFTSAYWDAIAAFIAKPDVDATISTVATLFTTHNVKKEAAWYQWP
jgi:glucose/mannose transport system substrate-binding protein